MAPKTTKSPKKKLRNVLDLGTKLKIINLLENGEKVAAVARKFNINESSVRTIRDNKDNIKQSASNLGQHAHLSKVSRNRNVSKMEEMLLIWIQDLIHKNVPLDTRTIRFQAIEFYEYLEEREQTGDSFVGSKGWFEKFKNRHGLHNMKFSGKFESHLKIELFALNRSYNRRKRISGSRGSSKFSSTSSQPD